MAGPDLSCLRRFVAPEMVFGAGAASLAGQFADNFSLRKVLLVTGPHLINLPWPAQVVESLERQGIGYAMYTGVSPNPRESQVMEGAEVYHNEECDGIVAVGGGSPMDLAKAVGIVSTNHKHVLEFEGLDNVERPGPPLICIPTTAGTAADVSQFSIINDTTRKVKIAIVSKTMVPDVSLIDPRTTTSMSPELTAHTGIDALAHAFEAYVSNACSPFTDLHALEAARLIHGYLARAVSDPGDVEAREKMMLASTFAGLGFSNAILGAVHALAHSLGGLLDMPHGLCNAILLDHVVDYNFDAAPDKYTNLARTMGLSIPETMPGEDVREKLVQAIRTLKQSVGVTCGLGAHGMTDGALPDLAQNALNDPCMLTNPKQPTLGDVIGLYEKAR